MQLYKMTISYVIQLHNRSSWVIIVLNSEIISQAAYTPRT